MTTTTTSGAERLELQIFGVTSGRWPSTFTDGLIKTMLAAGEGVSDLVFSPGRPPQVEKHGELTGVAVDEVTLLDPEHTARVARELIGGNEHALRTLKDNGACDLSYSVPNFARFRVNIFRQRGSFAIVMRVIATRIPSLEDLHLPASLGQIASLKNGIVLVTGPKIGRASCRERVYVLV